MTKCTTPSASFPRCKGRQIVADIIEGGYYYVDKTPLIHRLVEEARQR